MVETVISFFTHRTIKRVLALAVFVAGVILLRHLATLLVFYLIFSRGLGHLSSWLAGRTPIGERVWIGILLLLLLGSAGGLIAAGIHRSVPLVLQFSEDAQERFESLKESDLYRMLEGQHLDLERYSEQVRRFGEGLLHSLRTTGRILLHLVLGLILAVLFVFERKEVNEVWARAPGESLLGYLASFASFTAEAILLTIKVQVIVAAVNAVTTLPILLVLRLPHVAALMLMIFAFGLVPVVGNFLSGVVLAVLSYLKMGWPGVIIFVVSTFVLHKIESYYLNPRLTSRHVKLPSLLLVASLVIWEHLLGVAGLFVSFPVLYVGLRIRDLFREAPAPVPVAVAAELPPAPPPTSGVTTPAARG